MKNIFICLLGIIILASCSTSNEVVKNGIFQKRKYNKGWYVNKSKIVKNKRNFKNDNQQLVESENIESVGKNILESEDKIVLEDQDMICIQKENQEISKSQFKQKIVEILLPANSRKEEQFKEEKFESTDIYLVVHDQVSSTEPKEIKKIEKTNGGGDVSNNTLLLIIIAIFISWLSVGLYTGWDMGPVLLNLVLWLFGGGFYLGVGPLGGLLLLLAFIHALLILLDAI